MIEFVPPVIPLQLSPSTVAANTDLVVLLIVGILAGAHCLGMCGPLAGLYADRIAAQKPSHRRDILTLYEVRQHALFNGGRVVGYTATGALFGLLGATLFTTMDNVIAVGDGLRATTGILVGSLVMAGGLGYAFRGSTRIFSRDLPLVPRLFRNFNTALTGHVDRLASSSGIIGLGVIHAALPCPITYPVYLYAFAIGDPVRGALSLAVLGIGTFPSLFVYGTSVGSLRPARRESLHRALGVAFFALGYILLSHGLILLGYHIPHIDLPYYQPLAQP